MKTNARSGKPAFTLIELMAVITIIVILAALVVTGMGFVTDRQAKEKARVQIALLSKGIDDYKLDIGVLPGDVDNTPIAGTGVSEQLYTALFYEGYDYNKQGNPTTWTKKVGSVDVPKATRIYISDLDPTSTKQGWVTSVSTVPATTKILDPWGNEYRYRKGTYAQNADFDLWSTGKDGLTETANTPAGLKDKKNNDDVRNF